MFAMFDLREQKTRLGIRLTKDEKGKGDKPQERYFNGVLGFPKCLLVA